MSEFPVILDLEVGESDFIIDLLAHAVSIHVSEGNGPLGKTKEQVIQDARQAYREHKGA